MTLIVIGTLLLVSLSASTLYAEDTGQKVASVDIRGNKRIEDQAIRGRLTLKVGDPYTVDAIRAQIRVIYEMGFFEDVQLETEEKPDGIAVAFIVKEKPFITEVVFDGNENFSDDKLKEKITIRNQSFLDQQQVKESAEKIRLAYQEDGYYHAQVIPIVLTLEEDRKRLTFFIKEEDRARIQSVNFEGSTSATKKELFKVMATREWVSIWGTLTLKGLPSLFTDAGILKREELANDIERIKEVYLNKGFLNVQVGLPTIELTEDKKWFIITFSIVEGDRITLATLAFEGIPFLKMKN